MATDGCAAKVLLGLPGAAGHDGIVPAALIQVSDCQFLKIERSYMIALYGRCLL